MNYICLFPCIKLGLSEVIVLFRCICILHCTLHTRRGFTVVRVEGIVLNDTVTDFSVWNNLLAEPGRTPLYVRLLS